MLSFGVSERGASATMRSAILLYGGEDRSTGFATVHDVDDHNGRPTIMPGRLLQEADLAEMIKGIATAKASAETVWLDSRVLAKGPDRVIWWSAPGKRSMFFEKSSYNAKTFDGGAVCPVPGLIWMAMPSNGLYVYAFKGDGRPGPDTKLWQAPLFNIWGSGKVCVGSARLPSIEQQATLEAWEQTVFGSRFTHPNFTQKDRLIKGAEPASFWKRMVAKPAEAFPREKLVGVPLTIADLLERQVLDRLKAMPRPTGEF